MPGPQNYNILTCQSGPREATDLIVDANREPRIPGNDVVEPKCQRERWPWLTWRRNHGMLVEMGWSAVLRRLGQMRWQLRLRQVQDGLGEVANRVKHTAW